VTTEARPETGSNKSSPPRRGRWQKRTRSRAANSWSNSRRERQKRQTINDHFALAPAHLFTYLENGLARRTGGMVRSRKGFPDIMGWSHHLPDWTSFGTQIDGRNWNIPMAPTTAAPEGTRAARGPAILVTHCSRNSWNPVVAAASAVPVVVAVVAVVAAVVAVRKPGRHRPPRRQALTRAYLGPSPQRGPSPRRRLPSPSPPRGAR